MAGTEKDRALKAALTQIERQFGKGSMMRLGDREQELIPSVSTGSLGLDAALGVGGLPRGRVVEIYGPESSGKTTLTLQIIAEAQRAGGTCAFIDAEHALDPIYAESVGVDTDNLLVSQPDTGEQALEICDMIVRSAAVDVVVIDSVAALTPKAEIEGEMGDWHVGLQARLMSQALRKMTANIKQSNTLVIFINQIRMKIGVMFGSPETTTGGNALKFYSSVRLDIRRIGAIKDGDEIIGNETRVKGAQEQGGAAVQAGRVPDPLRQGHQSNRRDHRHRRCPGDCRQVRLLVQLQRRPHRPGTKERGGFPEPERNASKRNRRSRARGDTAAASSERKAEGKERSAKQAGVCAVALDTRDRHMR